MYLDVSLPVGVRHVTGIDGGAVNVPEAKDGVDEHMMPCDMYRRRSDECSGGEGWSI
jgi:hypothetical protein